MEPAEIINSKGASPWLLTVDHATNHLPREFEGSGLSADVLQDHVAVDIGARDLAVTISKQLDATVVAACFSRLVIDPNRAPDQAGLVPPVTDGRVISFNRDVGERELARRLSLYHEPFHAAINMQIRKRQKALGDTCLLLAGIHSFTPALKTGEDRPWHIGLMFNRDDRLARALRAALGREQGLVIGWNEPYSGREFFYTMDRHGGTNDLPHVQIEVRQDLLQDSKAVAEWADRLARAMKEVQAELSNA